MCQEGASTPLLASHLIMDLIKYVYGYYHAAIANQQKNVLALTKAREADTNILTYMNQLAQKVQEVQEQCFSKSIRVGASFVSPNIILSRIVRVVSNQPGGVKVRSQAIIQNNSSVNFSRNMINLARVNKMISKYMVKIGRAHV